MRNHRRSSQQLPAPETAKSKLKINKLLQPCEVYPCALSKIFRTRNLNSPLLFSCCAPIPFRSLTFAWTLDRGTGERGSIIIVLRLITLRVEGKGGERREGSAVPLPAAPSVISQTLPPSPRSSFWRANGNKTLSCLQRESPHPSPPLFFLGGSGSGGRGESAIFAKFISNYCYRLSSRW